MTSIITRTKNGIPIKSREERLLQEQRMNDFKLVHVAGQYLKDQKAYIMTQVPKEIDSNRITTIEINTTLGTGVFLNPDSKPLNAHTFLSLYQGEVQVASLDEDSPSPYIWTLFDPREQTGTIPERLKSKIIQIDGAAANHFSRSINRTFPSMQT